MCHESGCSREETVCVQQSLLQINARESLELQNRNRTTIQNSNVNRQLDMTKLRLKYRQTRRTNETDKQDTPEFN